MIINLLYPWKRNTIQESEARYFQYKKKNHNIDDIITNSRYIWTLFEMVHIILTILLIKGMESLSSRRLLRDHFKIMWKGMLASYKSSGKQINYIKIASAQGKNGYNLLKNDIEIGREIVTQPRKRNNEGRNPI